MASQPEVSQRHNIPSGSHSSGAFDRIFFFSARKDPGSCAKEVEHDCVVGFEIGVGGKAISQDKDKVKQHHKGQDPRVKRFWAWGFSALCLCG